MNVLKDVKESMSSVEIAELTDKEHAKVTADIEKMFKELEIDNAGFRVISKDTMNRDRKTYNLPKRECLLLVSGYNLKVRAAIIDRWQELENVVPMTQTELVLYSAQRLVAIEREQIELQKQQDLLSKDVEDINAKITEAISKERKPPEGFYSLRDCENKLAGMFPKTHVRGVISEGNPSIMVKQYTCTKWVEGTSTWTDYQSYCVQDLINVINLLVQSSVPVLGVFGTPTQKVKSPLYSQPFKHPM